MTEPRSVTEALAVEPYEWLDEYSGAKGWEEAMDLVRQTLAATPDPAPAVVPGWMPKSRSAAAGASRIIELPRVQEDGHCSGCGLVVSEEGRCSCRPDMFVNADVQWVAPAVVPDVEAAWEALWQDPDMIFETRRAAERAIARHRPLIEAAIRAEGRGALDVGLLARAKFNYDNPNDHDLWDIFGEASRESLRKWARRIVAEYDLLALPASAASQGPDGGKA